MLSISTNPYVLLLIVNVLLIVVGMFLDSTTAILVIAPIIAKPLVAAGVDPVHLGMVVVFNLMIGLLTPPMGLALFLVADIAKVSMKDVLKEMLPYYVPLAITLLLITYVPAITTWIPRWRSAALKESEMQKPVIALAMGDPAGISPELTAKVVALRGGRATPRASS